jgi:hypothetical protein
MTTALSNINVTDQPVQAANHTQLPPGFRPEFIRLPKTATLCPWSGLSRSKMWDVLVQGHVKTVCLRRKGAAKGTRLVHLESLMSYLNSLVEVIGSVESHPSPSSRGQPGTATGTKHDKGQGR